MIKKPLVSTLSMSFRRAVKPPESAEEAKKVHRESLHSLVTSYMDDVQTGKAEGIRNAKELVEVMKMDMLLLGEATDRTEQNTSFDEIRINNLSQYIDEDNEDIQKLMNDMLMGLNNANDSEDKASSRRQQEFAEKERGKFDSVDDSTPEANTSTEE